jgi:TATA-box binding protein (TBP) (component of TFIID and TFIIIB)
MSSAAITCLEDADNATALINDTLNNKIPEVARQHDTILPSDIRIATMTIVCRTSLGKVDVHSLRSAIDANPQGISEEINMSNKTMGNSSVIFKWRQDSRNIATKVFTTGSFHITGVKNPGEAVIISNFFCKRIDDLSKNGVAFASSSSLQQSSFTTSFEICMINSYFSIPHQINLQKAFALTSTSTVFLSKLNIEKHPGLQLKSKSNGVSVFLFSSGKAIVTGARSIVHILDVFGEICGFLSEQKEVICLPLVSKDKPKGKRGRKKKVVKDAFYEQFGDFMP